MRQRIPRLASIALVGAAIVLSFQNCGKAGFEGLEMASTDIQTNKMDSYPFAFEATFDQISYNSCFGNGAVGRPGFYSILAGGYETGGIRIREEFFTAVRTQGKVKPIYPATELSEYQIKKELASAPDSVEAAPQVAFRVKNSPQAVRAPSTNGQVATLTEGRDYITMLSDLTDDRWMDPLIKSEQVGNMTSYFSLAPSGLRNFEGTLTYNSSEGMAEGLRNELAGASRLSLTFKVRSDEGDSSMARPVVASDLSKVHGRGYDLTFESAIAPYTRLYAANPALYTNSPTNILTAIKEVDLADVSKVTGTWTCPEKRRYMIVRRVDRDQFCPPDPYSYMVNGLPSQGMTAAQYRKEHEIIRRSLKAEHWDISVEFKCASPKKPTTGSGNECYQTETGPAAQYGIEYDQRKPCYQGLPGINYGSSMPLKRCAQYVSICTRNN